jgi:hypothetical protein
MLKTEKREDIYAITHEHLCKNITNIFLRNKLFQP